MTNPKITRRDFLNTVGLSTGVLLAEGALSTVTAAGANKLHVATDQYPWFTFYRRENRDFNASLDNSLKEIASAGLDGYEPLAGNPAQVRQLGPLLRKHGLEMRSLYVNSVLHDAAQAERSIEQVLAIAREAKSLGTRIIVTNPSPLQWGGKQDKNDDQLRTQARALDRLGARLRELGLTLAYHNHDPELRQAAREFHHMLVGTDPEHVSFCLDAHWIYRGSGNSQVALFDVVKLYGARVVEVHLRQSKNGVWTEVFGEGDIDYPAVARALKDRGSRPHLVLEQAVEAGSPHTLTAVEAHRRGVEYVRRVFEVFAS